MGSPVSYDVIITKKKGVICQGNQYAASELHETFDLTICCAAEVPPPVARRVVHAPLYDRTSLTDEEIEQFKKLGRKAANMYIKGGRVLITCREGRNRSGMVTALAMHYAYGISGITAAALVRQRRRGAAALTNPTFNAYLASVRSTRRDRG